MGPQYRKFLQITIDYPHDARWTPIRSWAFCRNGVGCWGVLYIAERLAVYRWLRNKKLSHPSKYVLSKMNILSFVRNFLGIVRCLHVSRSSRLCERNTSIQCWLVKRWARLFGWKIDRRFFNNCGQYANIGAAKANGTTRLLKNWVNDWSTLLFNTVRQRLTDAAFSITVGWMIDCCH